MNLISEEENRNRSALKNFSDENFTVVSGNESAFGQGKDRIYRSLSDGEVTYYGARHESEETWRFVTNVNDLDDEHLRKTINLSLDTEGSSSSRPSAEVSEESSWIVLFEKEYLSNCSMSRTSSEPLERAGMDHNQYRQQPTEEAEERNKIKDEALLGLPTSDEDRPTEVNSKENQQCMRSSSVILEENDGDVDKKAVFYIGSRPNSGKLEKGSNGHAYSQGKDNGYKLKEGQRKRLKETIAGPQQTLGDLNDDIEVIPDEPSKRNDTFNEASTRFTEDATSPCYDQAISVTEQSAKSVGFGNNCWITACDGDSLLLPIVSEEPTLPQPVRVEKPVAIRAQPLTDVGLGLCPFECLSGLSQHKNNLKIDFNDNITSGSSSYNCGEEFGRQENTEVNLISLSSSSESNCSASDYQNKGSPKEVTLHELSTTASGEDNFIVSQCPKPPDNKQLIDGTDSNLYTVKSQSDLSIIVSKGKRSLSPQEVKNKKSSESTTPPLLITLETDPQIADVDDEEMTSDFHTTLPPNQEQSESSHTPVLECLTQHHESSATGHAVKKSLSDEKALLNKSKHLLNESSSTLADQAVNDTTSSGDIELETYFGEYVRERISHELLSTSDGVDPDLIHFFTNDAISPSPPLSAVTETASTDVDNEVADIMNTGSDDYVIEFKSESSNDWTISSAESEVGQIKVPASFDLDGDKGILIDSREDPATSPEPFQAHPPEEFPTEVNQDNENIYHNSFSSEGRKTMAQTEERNIEVLNEDDNTCPSKARQEPYGTHRQSYAGKDKTVISISPLKTFFGGEKSQLESIYQGGDILVNNPSVQLTSVQSVEEIEYKEIDQQENDPGKFYDPTKECGNETNSGTNPVAEISNNAIQPLERKTDSETMLERLPSVPCEPPTDVREDSPFDGEELFGGKVESSSTVCRDWLSLSAQVHEDVGSVTYPQLDMFAKARLRQGGLHHWEMNCLLTELSREQEENERLARDSRRAMEEFMQVKKEVQNILSKFSSQICAEMF